MKVTQLSPPPTQKIEFSFIGSKSVSAKMGTYAICNFHDEVMYVGLAIDLNRRIKEHLDSKEKTSVSEKGKAYWFYYLVLEHERDINRTERGWLNQSELEDGDLPIFNKIRSPVG